LVKHSVSFYEIRGQKTPLELLLMNNTNPLKKYFQGTLFVLFFLIISYAFCFPLLKELHLSCRGDWDYFASLYEVPSISIYEFGQFPLWNPYCGGGMPLIGNPQAGFLSPTFVLTSLIGVLAGLKISVWLHTFLGLWGMWLLSGYYGLKFPARLVPSLIFMFSSSWALHLTEGHIVWLSAAFLPFFFLAFQKSLEKKQWKWMLSAAIFESLMFYEGGTYVLAFSVLFIGVYALGYAIEIKRWQPLIAFVATGTVAVALSAPKLLPVLELLNSHPRPASAGVGMHWDEFLSLLIERNSVMGSGWWEFGSYFGIVVVVFYLASLSLFRKYTALIMASIFMMLVSLGNFAAFSPWIILHRLPFFSGFQLPTRSLIVFSFSVALLVGLYLGMPWRTTSKVATFLVGVIALIMGIDLFSVSSPIFREAPKPVAAPVCFSRTPVKRVVPKLFYASSAATTGIGHSVVSLHQPFTQINVPGVQRFAHGAWSDQYLPLLQNKGVVDAYETIPFERYAHATTDKDYKGEFYFLGKGKAVLLNWSPNKFKLHVMLQEKDRLVVNQNFWPGWRASSGLLTQHEGLLAIDLLPGDYDIVISYLPNSFTLGIGIFLATLGGLFILVFSTKKGRTSI
jgi:hypothetical protein